MATVLNPIIGTVSLIGIRADVTCIGSNPRARVDAYFKSHFVNIIGQTLHIGELLIALYGVILATAHSLPTIVDVNISPTVVNESALGHCTCRAQHLLLAHRVT